jgi:CheY-like chemotaxis protein
MLHRILLVEDDLDIQLVAQSALEKLGGFTVETCSTGREALEVAPRFAPDLILLDVMMPGMDGPSTLEALRTMPSVAETPVVFMTARSQKQEIEEYMALGALDVIAKPFDPLNLATMLKQIWESLPQM